MFSAKHSRQVEEPVLNVTCAEVSSAADHMALSLVTIMAALPVAIFRSNVAIPWPWTLTWDSFTSPQDVDANVMTLFATWPHVIYWEWSFPGCTTGEEWGEVWQEISGNHFERWWDDCSGLYPNAQVFSSSISSPIELNHIHIHTHPNLFSHLTVFPCHNQITCIPIIISLYHHYISL